MTRINLTHQVADYNLLALTFNKTLHMVSVIFSKVYSGCVSYLMLEAS